MKALYNYIDNIKQQHFAPGKKLERWKGIFESFETFLFVLPTPTLKGSHIRDARDLKRTMSIVILALLPALLFGMWNVGHFYFLSTGTEATLLQKFWFGFLKVLPLLVVSYGVGLAIEFIFVFYKGEEINEGFLVSGMLIPMVLPPDIPLWMLAIATAFAVVIGKEAFGGTGMNVFNPALLARAFLFFAYPAFMSGDKVWVSGMHKGAVIDGFSGATPLADAALSSANFNLFSHYSMMDMFIGMMPGSIGETSKLAILIGAAILLITGIASARIMFSVVIGGLLMGTIFNLFAVNSYMAMPAWQHLLIGGFLFGAVFMATDPVTSAQTSSGKIVYGLLTGAFAVLIRVLNPAYPEGMMLAILFMNTMAPLVDYFVIQLHISKRKKRFVKVN